MENNDSFLYIDNIEIPIYNPQIERDVSGEFLFGKNNVDNKFSFKINGELYRQQLLKIANNPLKGRFTSYLIIPSSTVILEGCLLTTYSEDIRNGYTEGAINIQVNYIRFIEPINK